MLGEELDNPQVTFKLVEYDLKGKIDLLSYKLYLYTKELEQEKQSNDDIKHKITKECKYLGESYYYAIKQHLGNLSKQIEIEKNLSSNLQKELITLKSNNEILVNSIFMMNNKLDHLENEIGIFEAYKNRSIKIHF